MVLASVALAGSLLATDAQARGGGGGGGHGGGFGGGHMSGFSGGHVGGFGGGMAGLGGMKPNLIGPGNRHPHLHSIRRWRFRPDLPASETTCGEQFAHP